MKLYTYYRLAGEFPRAHRVGPEKYRAGGQFSAPRQGRPVRGDISGHQSADDATNSDRPRHQALPILGYSRVSRRGKSGAAAVAGRHSSAGLSTRVRIDQRGRCSYANRAARLALPHRRAEGLRRLAYLDEPIANRPKITSAVPAHISPMVRGTPAFPVRCKVRLNAITRKPARV